MYQAQCVRPAKFFNPWMQDTLQDASMVPDRCSTFPEALQALHHLQSVAGVLAAHKRQHCQSISRCRLDGRRLSRGTDSLQQASALLQQPAQTLYIHS